MEAVFLRKINWNFTSITFRNENRISKKKQKQFEHQASSLDQIFLFGGEMPYFHEYFPHKHLCYYLKIVLIE